MRDGILTGARADVHNYVDNKWIRKNCSGRVIFFGQVIFWGKFLQSRCPGSADDALRMPKNISLPSPRRNDGAADAEKTHTFFF